MIKKFGIIALAAFSAHTVSADIVKPLDVNYDEYGAVEQSLTGVPGDPVNGAKVFSSKKKGNCVACHTSTALSEVPFHGEVGPTVDGVADRWTEAEVRGIVANAKRTFEGSVMPSFYKVDGFIRLGNRYTGKAHPGGEVEPLLAAQDIEDLVAWLMTLKEE